MAASSSYKEEDFEVILLECYKLRFQQPRHHTPRILSQIHEHLKVNNEFFRRNKIDVALAVQEVLRMCFEDNQYSKDTLKVCKDIIATLKRKTNSRISKSETGVHASRRTLEPKCDTKICEIFGNASKMAVEFPTLSEATSPKKDDKNEMKASVTFDQVKQLLQDVILKYRKKWCYQRSEGYVNCDITEQARDKIALTCHKHEEFTLKTLQNEFANFESVVVTCNDQKDVRNMLESLHGNLIKLQANVDKYLDERNTDKQKGDPRLEESSETKTQNSQLDDDEDDSLIQDLLINANLRPSNSVNNFPNGLPSNVEKTSETSFKENSSRKTTGKVYEIDFKPFVSNKPAERLVSINSGGSGIYYDFSQIWSDRSCWSSVKYKLLKRGTIETGILLLSLPNHRNEFIIGNGIFGTVELAFKTNYESVSLKRLTENGWNQGRCEALSKTLKQLHTTDHVNLVHTHLEQVGSQFFLYQDLCEYNLENYVLKLKEDKHLTMSVAKYLCIQIVRGLAVLHCSKSVVVHGNLKPSNVFVNEHGVLKVAEFGIYEHFFTPDFEIPLDNRIWLAGECQPLLKFRNIYKCTVMSDIQTCGMVLYYVITGGNHPYGSTTEEILHNLEGRVTDFKLDTMDVYSLLTPMFSPNPCQRPDIVEIINHIFFWSDDKKWEFLKICLAISNREYHPLTVSGTLAEKFCATLSEHWSQTATKFYWMASAFVHFPGIQIPHDARIDSGLGLLQFLNKCRHDNPALFYKPRLVLKAYPEFPCLIYNALKTTPWFLRDDLKIFGPFYTGGDISIFLQSTPHDIN